MSGAELLYLAVAAIAVLAALGMVTNRNPVVAAVYLIVTFFAMAMGYVMMAASFLGAIQVLVYAGAIMVLFVFVIMVLDVDERGDIERARPSRAARLTTVGLTTASVGFLAWVIVGTLSRQFVTNGADISRQREFGTAIAMGREIFGHYLFAFEAVSLTLMAAIIGAIVVAKTRRDQAAILRSKDAVRPLTDFGQPSSTGH
jgi:NADH-quinone oxidoreductase subunit J